MKLKVSLLLLAAALLAGLPVRAETKAPADPAKADEQGVLPVVIVEPVSAIGNAFTDFDRLAQAFAQVAKQRKWPVRIDAERLAGNQSEHATELRVTLQRVRQDPGEYVFRAWTTLVLNGEKHDFGIVTYRHSPRMGQNSEDLFEEIFLRGAGAIADKVEPLLFPDLKTRK